MHDFFPLCFRIQMQNMKLDQIKIWINTVSNKSIILAYLKPKLRIMTTLYFLILYLLGD